MATGPPGSYAVYATLAVCAVIRTTKAAAPGGIQASAGNCAALGAGSDRRTANALPMDASTIRPIASSGPRKPARTC